MHFTWLLIFSIQCEYSEDRECSCAEVMSDGHWLVMEAIEYSFYLSQTVTELICHIKCDHPACASDDDGHFERCYDVNLVIALNMA